MTRNVLLACRHCCPISGLSVFTEDPGILIRWMNADLAKPDSAKKLRVSAVAYGPMADTSARSGKAKLVEIMAILQYNSSGITTQIRRKITCSD
jgi:hypothetical protein